MVKRKRPTHLKPSWLMYSKLAAITLLILIELGNIIVSSVYLVDENEESIHAANFLTPSILIVSYVKKNYIFIFLIQLYITTILSRLKAIVMFFVITEVKYGLRSSMLLFVFWLLLLVSSSFMLRTRINDYTRFVSKIFLKVKLVILS